MWSRSVEIKKRRKLHEPESERRNKNFRREFIAKFIGYGERLLIAVIKRNVVLMTCD